MSDRRETSIDTTERAKVRVANDPETGRPFLQGTESATASEANVFSPYKPTSLRPRPIGMEAEVKYAFFARDEDDFDDRAEVYMFRLWNWKLVEGIAVPSLTLDWQDFTTGEFFGVEIWDELLREATRRIGDVRYNKRQFEPRLVGAPE